MTAPTPSGGPRTLPSAVSALPRTGPGSSLAVEYDKKLMVVSGRANPDLAGRIAEKLGVALSGVSLRTFSNGEVYCRFEESIRGADVFIVQPTCGNPTTGVTANDALMELLLMIDAAVGASAHRVIAVTPWYGYSRQDKKSLGREPISARLVARALEVAGADRVLTMDLHAGQIQGFFSKPVDHMTAMFMLTQYFRDMDLDDLVVVSPDAGRVKLAKKFAEKVGAELAILNKERPAQQVAEIAYVIGDVKGKTAVIVDDIIDTAGTLRAAAETVKDEGAHARLRRRHARRPLRQRLREPRRLRVRADRGDGHDPAARRRAGQHQGALGRRPAHGHDPPHLHRRLRVRGLRRREPALLSRTASDLQELLGLTDEELLRDPRRRPALPLLSGRARPPARAADPARPAGRRPGTGRRGRVRRWVRAAGPAGRPIDLLLARDFAAFEDAVDDARGARLRDRRALTQSSGSGRCSPGHVPVR